MRTRTFGAASAAIVLALSVSAILPTGVFVRSALSAQGPKLSNVSLSPTSLTGPVFKTVVSVSHVPAGTYEVSFDGSVEFMANDSVKCIITINGIQDNSVITEMGGSSSTETSTFAVTVGKQVPNDATVSGVCNDDSSMAAIRANAQITLVPQN